MLRKKQIKRWLVGSRPDGQALGIVSVAFLSLGLVSFFIGVGAVFREPAREVGGAAFVVMGVALIVVGVWGRTPGGRAAGAAGSTVATEPQFSKDTVEAILELARTKDREFFEAMVELARFDANSSAALTDMLDESRAAFDAELAREAEWFGELSQEEWESRRAIGKLGIENLAKDQVVPVPTRGRPQMVSATFRFEGETFALEIKSNWSEAIAGMVMNSLVRVLTNPAVKAVVLLVPAASYKQATRAVTDNRIIVVPDNSIEFIPQMIEERFTNVEEIFSTTEYAATTEIFPSVEDNLPSRRSARLAG